MLAAVLQWCYLLVVTYCLGFMFSEVCGKVLGYRLKRIEAYFLTGIIIMTVYTQFFSLFYKVGVVANISLLTVVLAIIVWKRKVLLKRICGIWQDSSIGSKIIVVFLFLLWAYFTSRGYMTYDTDLYHGQSIRWIEEYGVVKGLGNLHERFAYNSSIFALHALLSMKFLTGGVSLHTANGFFAFLLSITVLRVGQAWKRKKLNLSDYARVGAFYYLTTICDEILAPSSDYAVMIMIFYIIITWLELLEQKEGAEENMVPYCLLCVAGVYTLTLKLTAGLILLLLVKPAIYLLKNKQWKNITIYLLTGLLVAIPWIARSVIISGWLIYPLPELDLFSVDWKMPAKYIYTDVAQIQTWGRALYNAALADVPITQWFGNWFLTTLSTSQKLLILADIASLVILIIAIVVTLVCKKWKNLDVLLVLCTVGCSYMYWQYSAPLVRYGYAYVLLLSILTVGWLLSKLSFKLADGAVRLVCLIFGAYKFVCMIQYVLSCYLSAYYILPQDYERFELKENNVSGQIIYSPAEYGDRTGYYSFPSVPLVSDTLELRGDSLEDGFRRLD